MNSLWVDYSTTVVALCRFLMKKSEPTRCQRYGIRHCSYVVTRFGVIAAFDGVNLDFI
ncbi:hypothetical protein [Desulfobacter postgatei]|uniref:hypothetical protein n=1 Tax=Desulfobacter postgatei TaxID=2293 RepID=UPI00259B48CF|nr:hypothetical protein [uncultured Desulfobacter sp.]